MNPKGLVPILLALVFAIVLLAVTATYSAYVSSTNHRNSCTSRGLILDTFRDVVQLAVTPPAGEKVTAAQVARIAAFEDRADSRINQARC